jgi:hypothetical protein
MVMTAVGACFIGANKEETKRTLLKDRFPVICIFAYIPVVSVISFYDRYLMLPYLLVSMVLIIVVRDRAAVGSSSRKSSIISAALLIPGMLFSVLGTKDYLSWNRARWEGIHYLTNGLNLSPSKIDGGFEFNMWYNYLNPSTPLAQNAVSWDGAAIEFEVSLGPAENGEVLKTIPYQRFLPMRREEIVIVKKRWALPGAHKSSNSLNKRLK